MANAEARRADLLPVPRGSLRFLSAKKAAPIEPRRLNVELHRLLATGPKQKRIHGRS